MAELMGTAAQEAIRIAETFLPRASVQRKMALAKEIVAAIELCEGELAQDIIRGVKAGALGNEDAGS